MSVVIAIKNKQGVLVASDKQVTCGYLKSENATKINSFFYSNTAIGTVGYLRDCNIMSTMQEIIDPQDILQKKEINFEYVVDKVTEKIYNVLRDKHRLSYEKDIYNSESMFLFATPLRIFVISNDFGVVEYDSHTAIGCGDEKSFGFLDTYNTKEVKTMKEALEIATVTIKNACSRDPYIGSSIDYIELWKEGVKKS